MREYFAHKLRSSLVPWREATVICAEKIQMRYGLFFVGIDFIVTFGKKAVIIVIIDGIYKAPDLDVLYSQQTAFDLRRKILEVEKMEACDVVIAGRHLLQTKDGIINMTGIYSHEACFKKVFQHMKVWLGLPAVEVEEVHVCCRLRRKQSTNKIVPIPVEPFAVTHAQVLALLNGGHKKTVFASDQLGITDRSAPYGTLGR